MKVLYMCLFVKASGGKGTYLKTTTCEYAPLVTMDRLHMHVPSASRCHTPLLTTSSSSQPCVALLLSAHGLYAQHGSCCKQCA